MSRTKPTSPTAVWLFVEGGGSSRDEQAEIRKSFARLCDKVLGGGSKPRVIACGGRNQAFKDWKIARRSEQNTNCLLLVDSEGPVGDGVGPWDHVRARRGDGWDKPDGATEEQLHLMVETMEAWLVADPDALEAHYGQGFRRDALPARKDVEAIPKPQLVGAIERATRDTKTKGRYEKRHGFTLIGLVDPAKVRAAAPHAARFFDALLAACAALPRGRR